MAVKAKTGVAGLERKAARPKLTRQGQGKRSLPNHGRKKRVGQGR
jgi:hypothetical protein